jgi:threonine/homoserine/homoserine lactone efflux protein
MPTLPLLLSFVLAAFVVSIVPGSTVSAVVGTGLARGLRAGIATEVGAQIGRLLMVVLVALALEFVRAAMLWAFDWIKFAGAAYIAWLGLKFILSRPAEIGRGREGTARSFGRQVLSGILVTWSNPKSLLFFGAFLPQFVDPAHPAAPQIVLLGLIEMAIAAVTDTGYLLLFVKAREGMPRAAQLWIDRIAGTILIAAAIWLALQHHG